MASRLKKLLHTKKDEQDFPEYSEQDTTHTRRRLSKSGENTPATYHSLDNPNTVGGGYSPAGNTMSGPQSLDYARSDVASSREHGHEIPLARQQNELLSSDFSKLDLEGTHISLILYSFLDRQLTSSQEQGTRQILIKNCKQRLRIMPMVRTGIALAFVVSRRKILASSLQATILTSQSLKVNIRHNLPRTRRILCMQSRSRGKRKRKSKIFPERGPYHERRWVLGQSASP